MTWEVVPHGWSRKKKAPNLKETGFLAECRKQSSLQVKPVKAVRKGDRGEFGKL